MHICDLLLTLIMLWASAVDCMQDCLEPDTRVIGRWKNGNYYKGVVESLTNVISVLFDNGNRLSYNLHNNYDILEDRIPEENEIKWGDPVIVNRPHSFAYKPAHIREIVDGRYMIWYDDGSYIYQTKNDIRVFNRSGVCNEPAYLGCYRDKVPRYLTVFIPTRPATVGACVDMCNAQGFSIAALRNTDLCFCGNAYNKGYQTNNAKCDTPCFDNPYEMCGGVATFSQYWTGIVGDSPAHLPGGLMAQTEEHMDPYGFKPSYTTAITKQTIPRYGKLPWKQILSAHRKSKAPVSLASQSPWMWDAVTSSWRRADGKHFHWYKNKLVEDGTGTSRPQTSVVNTQWTKNRWSLAPKTPFHSNPSLVPALSRVQGHYPMNNPIFLPAKVQVISPGQGLQQYKAWRTPITSKQRAAKVINDAFAQTFTPKLVLEKLANRMAHANWNQLDTFKALPPAPKSFRYLGCFADDYQRDLPFTVPLYPLTSRSCILKCRERRFSVAGIQDSSLCFCGNSYSKYGRVREVECNKQCLMGHQDTCGGILRNSLYYTGIGSAWPKTSVAKKSSTVFHSSKDHKVIDPLRDVTVKFPAKVTSVTYTKVPSKHSKKSTTGKLKKQKVKSKRKKKPKLKTRKKIISSPASKNPSDFDDFRIESIKVKLNFSELKEALKTMSPSIVRRIQEDLKKISKLEKQYKKVPNKAEGEPKKGKAGNLSTTGYNKEIKKIREKLTKAPINHLTTKNMKDILKIMNIPESAFNIKTNVVHNGKTPSSNATSRNRNMAHEEIESYAKISLDFPFKEGEDQDSLNKKKELLNILAKHIVANRKDAGQNNSTNQKDGSKHISANHNATAKNISANHHSHKNLSTNAHQVAIKHVSVKKPSTIKKGAIKTKSQQFKSEKNRTIPQNAKTTLKPHKFRKTTANDNSIKPVKSQTNQEKPVKSLAKQEKPVKSLAKQEKPVKSQAKHDKPVKPLTKQGKPVKSPAKQEKTGKSPKKVTAFKSLVKKVKPVIPVTKEEKPVHHKSDDVADFITSLQVIAADEKRKSGTKGSSKTKKQGSKLVNTEKHVVQKEKAASFEDALAASSEPIKTNELPSNVYSEKKQKTNTNNKKDESGKSLKSTGRRIKNASKHKPNIKTKTDVSNKTSKKMHKDKKTSVGKVNKSPNSGKTEVKNVHGEKKPAKKQSDTGKNKIDNIKRKSLVKEDRKLSKSNGKNFLKEKVNIIETGSLHDKHAALKSKNSFSKAIIESHMVQKNSTNADTFKNRTSYRKENHGVLDTDMVKKTEALREPSKENKANGNIDLQTSSVPINSDENGVIYLADNTPDETSAFDESLVLNEGQDDGESVSGLPGLTSSDSNDENKLLSFQSDQQSKLNSENLGEAASGVAPLDDKQKNEQTDKFDEQDSIIDGPNSTQKKLGNRDSIYIIGNHSQGNIGLSRKLRGNGQSSYIYLGNGTVRDMQKLPLIREDDLERLLKQREDARKRSNTHQQEPSLVPSKAGKLINKQTLYTRSHIPRAKMNFKHIRKHNLADGLRVVKNGVAYTIDKRKKSSQKEYLNSLRKKLKEYKKASINRSHLQHSKRMLHHISERKNKKLTMYFKHSKSEEEDDDNDRPIEFRDEGAINELISRSHSP